ncbi:DUF6085 family protein [Streptomyces sp. NPDC002328]|uniref:DUF6085 family protein n=1 Tax=Streptomyces sp. NPDC002328 TaxID=3364642 RepID=UPI0036947F3D
MPTDQPSNPSTLPLAGHCPMGCGQTLQRRTPDGTVVCASDSCPRSDAVTTLLSDQETEHVVQFDEDGFTIRHPLRERLDDDLMQCQLHRFCVSRSGPPAGGPGRYRALVLGPATWAFEAIGGEPR